MLILRTLGGVYVVNEEGEPLTGAATQRRLLALLAALAVAGDRGLSRDKLVALLWPEADEERARHSLTQALYAARRALGADDLFVIGGDIRLNRERLGSDVQEMEEALDAGDLERAVTLYAGAFADGFFLPGSSEFEQWASAQRARLEDRIAGALDSLARREEESGRAREALEWRKRLAAIRPLDTSAAVALMTTLAHAGDRAGALQHAQLHETLLRDQLGLDPDPVVSSLVARLRAPVDWRAEPSLPPLAERTEEPAEVAPPEEPAMVPPVPRAAVGGARWLPRSRWWWLLAAAAVLVVVPAVLVRRDRAAALGASTVPSLEQKVVVAPFRVAGASASLGYLREGLVELLSTRLADDSGARSVDAGAVIAAWRAAGVSNPSEAPRSTVLQLAEGLGAERVVIGNVVGSTSRVVLTAAVVDVGSRQSTGEATVEGPADSITALVDRLAAKLLVLGAGEDESLADQTTESLSALHTFLDGQAAFRRGSYPLALRRYDQALRLDSTFALAAVQLARTADRLHVVEPRSRALALGWRWRAALDERAWALLVALAGPSYPAPSMAEEQIAAWERLIDLTPDRAEAWYELGARLVLEGRAAGASDAPVRAVRALWRAMQLDSTHTPTRELLARLAEPDSADLVPPSFGVSNRLPLAPFLEWRGAIARGDSAAIVRLRDSLPEFGPRNLRAVALSAQLDGVALEDARRAVQQLRLRAVRPDDRFDVALAEHALALNQGRPREALAATERLAEIQPGAQGHIRLRVLDALYGDGDSTAGAAAARQLAASVAPRAAEEPRARAIQLANACVLAQYRLQQGDTSGVRRAIEWLETGAARTAAVTPPLAAAPLACARLLTAGWAVALRRPDAPAAVARLDSLAFTVGSAGDAISYAPLFIARLHEQVGNLPAALEALRRREDLVGWPRYLATVWREEGRFATLLDAREEARGAFDRYLRLRAQPEATLRGQLAEVRALRAAAGGRSR